MAIAVQTEKFNVGGVLLDRPFKVRRMNHFGYNSDHWQDSFHFYTDLLGFMKTDGGPGSAFMRCAADHHSMVLFTRHPDRDKPGCDPIINQITWQVGSMREVSEGAAWITRKGIPVRTPLGRAPASSSFHFYFFDPEGRVDELNYAMAQIGWNGESRPKAMVEMLTERFEEDQSLPQPPDGYDVDYTISLGMDIHSGTVSRVARGEYDVDGVLLTRPFKIMKLGPLSLFVEDMDVCEAFYRDVMGFTRTEEIVWEGHRCIFMRANTEHHVLGLYPMALRETFDFARDTSCMSVGFQIMNYQQLKHAVSYLKSEGVTVKELPPELFPGLGHNVFVFDPDGHAVQLYSYMEQIGWDGKPRPASLRPKVTPGAWPDTLEPESDTYHGEVFNGPIG